jgi:DNA-binding PadR family transcriptional regulator
MSVRHSLLAILDQGPCYGYQLRAEFDRRTGSTWPLNVGQIYNTLDRLERDGLAAKGETDEQGHVFWVITDAGRAEVRRWLDSPTERAAPRNDLAIKVAVAATLPGVDVAEVLRAQRRASGARLDELTRRAAGAEAPAGAAGFAGSLIADALVFAAEAEVKWLDHAAARLSRHPARALPLQLATERPKRGRPTRAEASAVA